MGFNILQNDGNFKHLSQFYKILSSLWINDDFIENFDTYISQLNRIIQEIFNLDENQLRALPNAKTELIKLFYILKGIISGLNSTKHFGLFFEWFYPDYFQIITRALAVFIEDDELTYIIFKFLLELLNNRGGRLRFDTWNINGLVIFKETSKIINDYLTLFDCLSRKSVKRDKYRDIYKFLDIFIQVANNCISGGFINFAVCSFYEDNSFNSFISNVMKSLCN